MLRVRRHLARPALAMTTAVLVANLSACSPGSNPSPAPSPSPTTSAVVVSIRVAGAETYRVLLTDPADIAIARDLLAGKEAPRGPERQGRSGRRRRGEHRLQLAHRPVDFEWADVTVEVCDGKPSDVEAATITSDRLCPWFAEVVAINPGYGETGLGEGMTQPRDGQTPARHALA